MNFKDFNNDHSKDFSWPIFWYLKSLEDYVSFNYKDIYEFDYTKTNTLKIAKKGGTKILNVKNKNPGIRCEYTSDLVIELYNPIHGSSIKDENINHLNFSI